jgi:hypothetical protein
VFEAWAEAAKAGEEGAATEAAGFWGQRLREGVFLAVFLWFRVAADLARVDLVRTSRRSAFLAFFRGLGRTLVSPVRTLGTAAALGVPAFLLLLLLAAVVRSATSASAVALVATFVAIQAAVLVRWASRAALLGSFAASGRPRAS